MLEALKTINGATRLYSGILGDRNHGFDPASVFLSKIGLFCRSLIPFHGKRETYFRRKNPAVSISKFLSPEMPLYGESAVTAAPMFEHACRNGCDVDFVYWHLILVTPDGHTFVCAVLPDLSAWRCSKSLRMYQS